MFGMFGRFNLEKGLQALGDLNFQKDLFEWSYAVVLGFETLNLKCCKFEIFGRGCYGWKPSSSSNLSIRAFELILLFKLGSL